jgi:hypothetical protein
MASVCLVAALAFAGSLEEVTRLGIMNWLYHDDFGSGCMFYAAKWQKTLWSMWQIYNKGKNAQTWLTSVPKEVLEMDCWKPVDSLDDW